MDLNALRSLELRDAARKQYFTKMVTWMRDAFLNTSSADVSQEWFFRCVIDTLDAQIKKNTHGGRTEEKPILIGLCGQAGAGKDSALQYFRLEHDVRTGYLAFAEPLKEIAKIFGFTQKQLTDRREKETKDFFWGISPRQFLQMCGTEMFRKVWREDVWTELATKRINDLSRPYEYNTGFPHGNVGYRRLIFVTDVRFPNEVESIRKQGGIVVKIVRPNNPLAISATHDSERFVNELKADLEIVNDAKDENEWSWKFTRYLIQHFDHAAFYYNKA